MGAVGGSAIAGEFSGQTTLEVGNLPQDPAAVTDDAPPGMGWQIDL